MEISRHFLDGFDIDLGGSQSIEPGADLSKVHGGQHRAVSDLTERMNTLVRPPGTSDPYWFLQQLVQCFLDISLDSANFRLDLPAMKISAVVFDSEFEVLHNGLYAFSIEKQVVLKAVHGRFCYIH